MSKIHFPITFSFLIILISVLVLAVLQGNSITNALLGKNGVEVNEVQEIAFIMLTLFILITATLHPDKIYLSAYSSMTLGLIVIIGSFYNIFIGNDGINVLQFLMGVVLIIAGALLFKHTKLSSEEKNVVYEGIKHYK